jgi:hypothetical protein
MACRMDLEVEMHLLGRESAGVNTAERWSSLLIDSRSDGPVP